MRNDDIAVLIFFSIILIFFGLIWVSAIRERRAKKARREIDAKWLAAEKLEPRFRLAVYVRDEIRPLYSVACEPKVSQYSTQSIYSTSYDVANEFAIGIVSGGAYQHNDVDGTLFFPHHWITSVIVERVPK